MSTPPIRGTSVNESVATKSRPMGDFGSEFDRRRHASLRCPPQRPIRIRQPCESTRSSQRADPLSGACASTGAPGHWAQVSPPASHTPPSGTRALRPWSPQHTDREEVDMVIIRRHPFQEPADVRREMLAGQPHAPPSPSEPFVPAIDCTSEGEDIVCRGRAVG